MKLNFVIIFLVQVLGCGLNTNGNVDANLPQKYLLKLVKNPLLVWDPFSTFESTKKNFKKQLDAAGIDRVFGIVQNFNAATPTYAFYHANDPGGAFANTFESENSFSCNGVMTKFAEFCFQTEKVFRFSRDENLQNYQSFAQAFEDVKNTKTEGWGKFPQQIRAKFMESDRKKTGYDFTKWDEISLIIMARIHAERFKAEPNLFLGLITTKADSVIVEDSPSDGTWGRGGKLTPVITGKNQLGLLYMLHRERFWADFKAKHQRFFDKKRKEDIEYMKTWLKTYDGRINSEYY